MYEGLARGGRLRRRDRFLRIRVQRVDAFLSPTLASLCTGRRPTVQTGAASVARTAFRGSGRNASRNACVVHRSTEHGHYSARAPRAARKGSATFEVLGRAGCVQARLHDSVAAYIGGLWPLQATAPTLVTGPQGGRAVEAWSPNLRRVAPLLSAAGARKSGKPAVTTIGVPRC
jgi:hypothetical protein